MKSESNELVDRHSNEARLLRLYLQFILDVRSLKANSALMEVNGDQLQLVLLSTENGQSTPLKTLAAPASMMSSWLSFLLDRVFFWSDLGDELHASNPGRVKRLMIAPSSPARFFGDFAVTRKAVGAPNQIVISNIKTDGIPPILHGLSLSLKNTQIFERILKVRSGIILASSSAKPHAVDGVAALLAMRPEACVLKHCNSEKTAVEALGLSESHLVIVGGTGDDPIDRVRIGRRVQEPRRLRR